MLRRLVVRKTKISPYDKLIKIPKPTLSIIGPNLWGDGLGRILPSLVYSLKTTERITTYSRSLGFNPKLSIDTLPEKIKKLDLKPTGTTIADRCIFTGLQDVGDFHSYNFTHYLPLIQKATKQRIAISMLEGTKIPDKWAKSLNTYFTDVIVPSEFLVDVYKSCGVKIPIHCIPLPIIEMEDWLQTIPLYNPKPPFTFGIISGGWTRKMVAEAMATFTKTFPKEVPVRMLVHSRFGDEPYMTQINETAKKDYRIQLSIGVIIERELNNIKRQIHCYLLPSCGEGFSFTPREFLAKGIPTIISDNSAHQIIVKEEGAIGLPTQYMRPAYYGYFGELGEEWVPNMEQLGNEMLNVYQKPQEAHSKVLEARQGLTKYLPKNVSMKLTELLRG